MPNEPLPLEQSRPAHGVLLAGPRAFCAGVERAIEIVRRLLDQHGAPIYVRKQIVHNVHVVHDLQRQGAVFVDELEEVPAGATVVFSAHGVSPKVRDEAGARGLDVIDATCPLVTKVHSQVRRYARRGDTVVLIGHAGHDEAVGTLGQAPQQTVLVETVDDVAKLDITGPVSYVTQTTLAVEEAQAIVAALNQRFPGIAGPDSEDICYATTNRQRAVRAVAEDADVILVVGSANSTNSNNLVEVARRSGTPAYLIEDAGSIDPGWLAGATVVGVTAGASASPDLVAGVVEWLAEHGHTEVAERNITTEMMSFGLPLEVRDK
ncbi:MULTISPECIES: 4-hydroxy-3-methylbut-2-enyl diphosphate reductase [Amycolatopsis]|uniref:4-hydroxy-3-methylbut-2-enyl diphosphate reductase n=1 Tax=Amycolatopsis albidoflavus TaxID=102226 RepID=A0ABW5I7F7_9PSEU